MTYIFSAAINKIGGILSCFAGLSYTHYERKWREDNVYNFTGCFYQYYEVH